MATLTITNSGATDVYCSDLFAVIRAGATITTTRAATDLARMATLQSLIAAGSVAVSVAYSASEIASGLVDTGATASAASGLGSDDVLRFAITAGAGGSADDVVLYALNSLPYKKMRVLDATAFISAGASAGRTLQVRSAAAGLGTLLAEVTAAATGRADQTVTVTATSAITNGSAVGLFVRRSDSAIAGEIQVRVRREV